VGAFLDDDDDDDDDGDWRLFSWRPRAAELGHMCNRYVDKTASLNILTNERIVKNDTRTTCKRRMYRTIDDDDDDDDRICYSTV